MKSLLWTFCFGLGWFVFVGAVFDWVGWDTSSTVVVGIGGLTLWIPLYGERLWRRARGTHGGFAVADRGPRAAQLDELWSRAWPSAPEVTRAGAAEAQRTTRILDPRTKPWRRMRDLPAHHRAQIDALRGQVPLGELIVIGLETGWDTHFSGWFRAALRQAQPWRIEGQDRPVFLWTAEGLTEGDLDRALRNARGARRRIIVAAPDLAWLYAVYRGAADIRSQMTNHGG